MERLTKRYTYNGKPEISVDSEINGISCSNFCTSCGEADCEDIRKTLFKMAEYEDLEEQGKLLKLPCAVGDTVYVIPSETNYKLNIISGHGENNRVYEQIVNRIEISEKGYLLVTCDGMESVIDTFYKKTWFLTGEEAEAALKEAERRQGENEID